MSLGSVFPPSMPDLNSPFDLTRLKLRQQSALQGFRLPVLRNYSNANKKLERIAERLENAKLYDNDHILKLTSQTSSENYTKDFVNVPVEQNEELMDNVRKASAAEAEDDDSVVSETVSDDDEHDPKDYKDAKAEVRKSRTKVRELRKRAGNVVKVIKRLEDKEKNGGTLTEREKALHKQANDEAIDTYVEAANAVPQVKANLKAYRKNKVREMIKGHLVSVAGAGSNDANAQAAQRIQRWLKNSKSSLRLGVGDILWYSGRHVNPESLDKKSAARILRVITAKDNTLDILTPEGAAEHNILHKHYGKLLQRIAELDSEEAKAKPKGGKGAGAGSSSASAALPTRAASRAASRATSPAPPATSPTIPEVWNETEEEEEGGGDGRSKVKLKKGKAKEASQEEATETKAKASEYKVDDNLYMNRVGRDLVLYLDKVEAKTVEQFDKVLKRLSADNSEPAKKIKETVKRWRREIETPPTQK
jgi:hypothetical protein